MNLEKIERLNIQKHFKTENEIIADLRDAFPHAIDWQIREILNYLLEKKCQNQKTSNTTS